MDKTESLLVVEQHLISLREQLAKQNGYKYWIAALFLILFFVLFFCALVPLVNYLLNNLQDPSLLKAALDGSKLIPEKFSIMDALGQIFITAWAINDRTPRFFSKFSFKNWNDPKFDHTMSFNNMVLASAATPYYFKPVMIPGHVSPYIDGSNVAASPALYAMLNAIQNDGVKQEDIRIVSVG